MGIKLVAIGSKRFNDQRLLYRALDGVHRKHHIDTLVTGARPGAEAMIYQWGIAREIRIVATIPGLTLNDQKNLHNRNRDMLQYSLPQAVVVFCTPHEAAAADMIASALALGYKVWSVPADWRG